MFFSPNSPKASIREGMACDLPFLSDRPSEEKSFSAEESPYFARNSSEASRVVSPLPFLSGVPASAESFPEETGCSVTLSSLSASPDQSARVPPSRLFSRRRMSRTPEYMSM